MAIINFVVANWDSVLVVLLALGGALFLIKRGETKVLESILYRLVTKAEQRYGDGTGSLKFSAVADWLYERIPAVLKFLFTAKDIENLIETALAEAKKKWAANSNIQEYIQGAEYGIIIDDEELT